MMSDSIALISFISMNPTTSPGPTANSVYVVPPYNGYPVITGTVSQVPLYPGNQNQIHIIHGNPPGAVPVQKVLKDGKVLGVSESSLCDPEATLQIEESRGLR